MNNDNTNINVHYLKKNEINYKIGMTIKKANKKTQIYCQNNDVIWKQIYPLGIKPVSEEFIVCKPSAFMEKDHICVLVIAGKPDGISGLEEGVFLSKKSFDSLDFNRLYVMSEAAFRELNMQVEGL